MTGAAKQRSLILVGLVILITMIIAAGLPRLKLQPGLPLPRLENSRLVIQPAGPEPLQFIPVNQFFSVFFTLLLLGGLAYILIKVIRGANWKDLAGFFRLVLVICLISGAFLFIIQLLPGRANLAGSETPLPTPLPPATSPLGPVPASLIWLAAIGLLLTGIIALVWIVVSLSRKARPIHLVGLEAEKAWQALKTGLNLKDVIMQCYRQMGLAVKQEQGLERKEFMTTGEFETLLEKAGLPPDPIHQLTRLFEAVRYGDWQPNPIDEQKAIHCLEEIMSYSRAAGGNAVK
jgi:hypothetical protein